MFVILVCSSSIIGCVCLLPGISCAVVLVVFVPSSFGGLERAGFFLVVAVPGVIFIYTFYGHTYSPRS